MINLKFPKIPHWHTSPGMKDYSFFLPSHHYFLRDSPVVVTEKIDGSNICLFDGQVYARGFGGPSTRLWHGMTKKHHAWKTQGNKKLAFYGEDIFGVHSLEYYPRREKELFFLFAVRNIKFDYWLSWSEVLDLAYKHEFQVVPDIFLGNRDDISSLMKELFCLPPVLGKEREGFVVRSMRGFDNKYFHNSICKYVRRNHVKTDIHWTKNWKPARILK